MFVLGQSYSLTIDAKWQDGAGRPLSRSFVRKFRIGQSDQTQPDPKRWVVRTPRRGTREALDIHFAGCIDHALLERMIVIENTQGIELDGQIKILESETAWRFTPNEAWAEGKHSIVVDTELEDPSGNNILALFEVDLIESPDAPARPATARIVFEPR